VENNFEENWKIFKLFLKVMKKRTFFKQIFFAATTTVNAKNVEISKTDFYHIFLQKTPQASFIVAYGEKFFEKKLPKVKILNFDMFPLR